MLAQHVKLFGCQHRPPLGVGFENLKRFRALLGHLDVSFSTNNSPCMLVTGLDEFTRGLEYWFCFFVHAVILRHSTVKKEGWRVT
jgi:hypothetical protein